MWAAALPARCSNYVSTCTPAASPDSASSPHTDSRTRATALIGDVALSPDDHILYAADLHNDSISVINLQSGQLTGRWKTVRRPYRILPLPGGRDVLVSQLG